MNLANEVFLILRDLARDGCIVCVAEHNPTQLSFSLFDRILLLTADGRPAYDGPRRDIADFFHFTNNDGRFTLIDWIAEFASGGCTPKLTEARRLQVGYRLTRKAPSVTFRCSLQWKNI